jgi:hypothetical protein
LLTSPDYDDARLSAMLERAKGRSRALRQRQRRRLAVIAAAAAVVLAAGGTWYGLGAAGRPAGAVNEIAAVGGCRRLAATSGTLARVTGASLVLKSTGDAPVTVTVPASASVSRQVAGTAGDITDGAYVIVFGTGSRGRIAALHIMTGTLPGLSSGPAPPRGRRGHAPHPGQRRSAAGGVAAGKVTGAHAGGFTVIEGGVGVRVTISGSTTVYAQASATVGQLQPGTFVVAVGTAKAGGALVAATVQQGAGLPHIQHGNGIVWPSWLGCSPSAVATAALLAAG